MMRKYLFFLLMPMEDPRFVINKVRWKSVVRSICVPTRNIATLEKNRVHHPFRILSPTSSTIGALMKVDIPHNPSFISKAILPPQTNAPTKFWVSNKTDKVVSKEILHRIIFFPERKSGLIEGRKTGSAARTFHHNPDGITIQLKDSASEFLMR